MEVIASMLKKFGLNASEAKVYATLLILQDAKASDIAKQAGVPRNKLYEIAESLNKKGFVEIIPEKVMKFRAVPFETVCDMQMNSWQRQLEEVSRSKNEVMQRIKKMSEPSQEKGYFAVLRSKKVIRKKIEDMMESGDRVIMLLNVSDLRNLVNTTKKYADKVDIDVMAPINKDSTPLAKKWARFAEIRHYETTMQEKIIIAKDSVLIFEFSSPIALYSNDSKFVSMLRSFVNAEWGNAVPAEERIKEVETGKPSDKVIMLRGREALYSMLPDLYADAKKDIILMTSENGLVRINKHLKKHLEEAKARGVRIRIVTKITKANLETARNMLAEIRHVDHIHAVLTCYDDSMVSMHDIKVDNTTRNSPNDVVLISNNHGTVSMMRQMLEKMWEEATPLEEQLRVLAGEPVQEMKVIIGTDKIYQMLRDITAQANEEIVILSTAETLRRSVEHGTWDLDKKLSKHVKVRYLLSITERNLDLVKKAMEFADIRHIDSTPIRMRMIDGEECTLRYGDDVKYSKEICVYSNVRNYVASVREYFESAWQKAMPAEKRIKQLEETKKKEISIIVDSIEQLDKYPIRAMHDKGIKVKVLLPVKPGNSEQLMQLEKYAEIRHIPEVFLFSVQLRKREGLFQNMWHSAQPLKERMAEIER